MFVFFILTLCIAVLIDSSKNTDSEILVGQKESVENKSFVNHKGK
jgi:preprotein translocase subunit SecG